MKNYVIGIVFLIILSKTGYCQDTVTLSLNEYKKLAAKVIVEKHRVPVDFIISRADYQVTVTKKSTQIAAEYHLEIFGNNWVQVPLMPATIPLKNFLVDGEKALLLAKNKNYVLLFRKAGKCKVTFAFQLPSLYSSKMVHFRTVPSECRKS